ncbi:hypothetical protein PG987_013634 [Apiospora arundinis]
MSASNDHSVNSITRWVQDMAIGNSEPEKGPKVTVMYDLDAVCSSEPFEQSPRNNQTVVEIPGSAEAGFPLSLIFHVGVLDREAYSDDDDEEESSTHDVGGGTDTSESEEEGVKGKKKGGDKAVTALIHLSFFMHYRVDGVTFPEDCVGPHMEFFKVEGVLTDAEADNNALTLLASLTSQPDVAQYDDLRHRVYASWVGASIHAVGRERWEESASAFDAAMESLDTQMIRDTLRKAFIRLRRQYEKELALDEEE